MNRMLKALEQIESMRPAVPPSPAEPVRGQDEMEATLAAAERAVAEGGKWNADGGRRKARGTSGFVMPESRGAESTIQTPPQAPSPQRTPEPIDLTGSAQGSDSTQPPGAGDTGLFTDADARAQCVQSKPDAQAKAAGDGSLACAAAGLNGAVSSPAAIAEAVEDAPAATSTPPQDPDQRWRRFLPDPVAMATGPAGQSAAPDRSCVSPLLRPTAADRAPKSPAVEAAAKPAPAPAAPSHPATPAPAAAATDAQPATTAGRPTSARAGMHKLKSPLKGEVAEMGRIILSQLGPTHPATILLTTSDGEIQRGVSLLALATTLRQQIEGEVVLVGCDWQSKWAAERYGITAERGLIDLLSGAARGAKVLQRVGSPPISVLLGRGYASLAQLPKDFAWHSLVRQLKQRYSLTILDASGMACAQAAPIARHCDGTYFLVLAHHTPRRAAARAVGLLSRAEARLLGCMLVTG